MQYCVGVYLIKDYDLALEIFDSISAILGDKPLEHLKSSELNELFLFKALILESKGQYK